jgi:hypothetical protein
VAGGEMESGTHISMLKLREINVLGLKCFGRISFPFGIINMVNTIMKVFSNLLIALASTSLFSPIVRADWKNLTASDFKLKQSGYRSSLIEDLDKALPGKKVKDIIRDVNHPALPTRPNVKGLVEGSSFTWHHDKDGNFDDVNTRKWYPQGITTSADAFENGKYDGEEINIVSWHSDKYDNGKRGVRLSFVRMTDIASNRYYRHVLLVYPKRDKHGVASFKAVRVHAGGLFWYGTLLYVVDTDNGLRVFDLEHIYQVDTGKGALRHIGRVEKRKYQAYGYK